MMKPKTIAIIGAGSVGTTTAYALILQSIPAEIVLIDINEARCRGEVLDLEDALGFSNTPGIRSGNAQDARNADIIIITAGARQKPNQSRIELLKTNKKIISSICEQLKQINQHAIIIMVTNPLDILTRLAQQELDLPHTQIFGTGTFLDSQRLQGILAQKLNSTRKSIQAYMLGEHGDLQFPAWSTTQIKDKPLHEFNLSKKELELITQETRNRAYEIISCKGATFYGIAACVATMCHAIIFDEKLVLPLSVYLKGFDICLSMPVVLGKNGIEQILDISLNAQEQEKLTQSVATLKEMLKP